MDLSAISGFFEQSVPIGVVAILIFQAVLSRDVKYINEKLDNHITDTNKKIDSLSSDLNQFKTEMNQFKTEMNQFKTEVSVFQKEVSIKLDRLLSKGS